MRPIPPSLLQILLLLGIALLAGTPSSGQETRAKGSSEASPSGVPADPTLEALVEAHNKIRAEEKLPPLKAQAQLTVAVRNQARDMAEHKQLTHEGSDGSNPGTRIKRTGYVFKGYGENVAQGQETVGRRHVRLDREPSPSQEHPRRFHRDGRRRRQGLGRAGFLVR